MAYIDLETLKTYIGTEKSGDNYLLAACLDRAIAVFDSHFDHRFEASTETRYYRGIDIYQGALWLDSPLLTVTTLTNGDAAGTVIDAADYWLQPRNESPYWLIELKSGGDTAYFAFDTDGEVSVTGTWGYTTIAPDDVVQAVIRLSAYFYRQKDSQIFETTAVPELGILTIPAGVPQDVKMMIEALQARYSLV